MKRDLIITAVAVLLVLACDSKPHSSQKPAFPALTPVAPTTQPADARRRGDPAARAVEEWTPWDKAAKADGIQVKVISVSVGRTKVIEAGKERQSEYCLATKIDIFNTTESRKYDYQTWGSDAAAYPAPNATLEDEFGNTYRRINFGLGAAPVGRTAEAAIYPRKSITDVLIFEYPVDKAQDLYLRLPAENLGGKGEFRIKIPTKVIQRKSG